MKSKLKKILKISIPLLLSAAAVWYSFSIFPFDSLINSITKADYRWIILGAFLGLLSHLSRAYRWRFQLESIGYNIKLGNSIMAVLANYLINYTIPRAGEIGRATIILNYEGIPFEKSLGTIISERIIDLVVMVGIIVLTLFLQHDIIYLKLTEVISPLNILTIGCVGLILLFVMITIIIKAKTRIAVKIKYFVKGLLEGILSIFKMKKKWPFIFHTLFIWGMYIIMFYVTSLSVTEINNISFDAILIGFIFASFSIMTTNGGIGSYPLAVYAAFSIFNIPEDPSIAFGWIMWASQTLMIILFGGLALIYLPFYNRQYSRK